MKAPDLPKEPTNAQLGAAITAVHGCLHEQGAKVDTLVADMATIKPTVLGIIGIRKWIVAATIAILGSVGGSIYSNWALHNSTASKVESTAANLKAYTADQAWTDHAKQVERDEALTAALTKLAQRVGETEHTAKGRTR